MECPTCFQKITVPQAPASDDQKFIITGTKVGERPAPKIPDAGRFASRGKRFPGALVVVIILLFIGAAVAFVYRGTIFKSRTAVRRPTDIKPIVRKTRASQTVARRAARERHELDVESRRRDEFPIRRRRDGFTDRISSSSARFFRTAH